MRFEDARSLALHRAVRAHLEREPSRIEVALERARCGRERGEPYAPAWCALLEGPRDALFELLTEDSERAITLRSCSPFAGVLPPRERWAILAETRRPKPERG